MAQVLNKKDIVETFGIHPNNFAMARAIAGDKSDNLPGVGGAGLATIAKRFPFLELEESATLDQILEACAEVEKPLKVHENILEHVDRVKTNYKMMQLYSPMLSPQSKDFVRNAVENFECNFNKIEIIKKMRDDGFGELNWKDLELHLNKINSEC